MIHEHTLVGFSFKKWTGLAWHIHHGFHTTLDAVISTRTLLTWKSNMSLHTQLECMLQWLVCYYLCINHSLTQLLITFKGLFFKNLFLKLRLSEYLHTDAGLNLAASSGLSESSLDVHSPKTCMLGYLVIRPLTGDLSRWFPVRM